MKAFGPVVLGLIVLVVGSFLFGMAMNTMGLTLTFSAMFYLLLCFAQMLHSLEEYLTQFWKRTADTTLLTTWMRFRDTKPIMDRAFFVFFNVVLNATMLLFYEPISYGVPWSWLFGLGMAGVGVGNGILHCGMAVKQRRYFSGCISATLTFTTGALVLTSLSFHI